MQPAELGSQKTYPSWEFAGPRGRNGGHGVLVGLQPSCALVGLFRFLFPEDALLHAPAPPCLLHAIACGGIGVRSACANFAWMPGGPSACSANSAADVAG